MRSFRFDPEEILETVQMVQMENLDIRTITMGISLREWRHRLRLFLALEWLESKRSVTDIALDLGYSSTAAFTYMFRSEMGFTPTGWRSRV